MIFSIPKTAMRAAASAQQDLFPSAAGELPSIRGMGSLIAEDLIRRVAAGQLAEESLLPGHERAAELLVSCIPRPDLEEFYNHLPKCAKRRRRLALVNAIAGACDKLIAEVMGWPA